jgi:hypothetical protein
VVTAQDPRIAAIKYDKDISFRAQNKMLGPVPDNDVISTVTLARLLISISGQLLTR